MVRRRFLSSALKVLPVLALASLLLVALFLSGLAAGGSERLTRVFPWVFAGSVVAVAILALAIIGRLWGLIRDLRRGAPGAALSFRLVLMFVVLAVPPVLVVYGFSLRAVHDSIASGVDARFEAAMRDALAVGQSVLDERRREALRLTRDLADALRALPLDERVLRMESALDDHGASEISLFESGGHVVDSVSADFSRLLPDLPTDDLLLQAAQGGSLASAELIDERLALRGLARVDAASALAPDLWLQVLLPLPADLAPLLENIEREVHRHQRLVYLRASLGESFTLILSAVLLLSALLAILAAFALARRLVAPVARLALATREVAEGRKVQPLMEPANDELGFLVRAFNSMVRQLDLASASAQQSAAETEAQRAYLQTVLQRLSSGVIGVDAELRLRTVNNAVAVVLEVDLTAAIGEPLTKLRNRHPSLAPLFDLISGQAGKLAREWRQELRLDCGSEQRLLMARAARLPAAAEGGGWVVVLDDLTVLNRAQRDAAWAEVARRLAHEIKNPLTPIQLAAERLRRKYLTVLPEADAAVLDRATHTIVAQVEALKQIVNEFSDYARPQLSRRDPVALDQLLTEVLDLYDGDTGVELRRDISTDLPTLRADPGRLRQLLHNLLRNAQEAVVDTQHARVTVSLHAAARGDRDGLLLRIADNGPGVPPALRERLFEPYTTSKAKGTGLGLAIVKRIVDEHGGELSVEHPPDGGACFVLWLAVDAAAG